MRNLLCSILAGGLILLAGCSQSPTQVDGFNVRRASGEVGVLSPDARVRYRTALEHASQQEYTKAEKALLQQIGRASCRESTEASEEDVAIKKARAENAAKGTTR